ncbi:hypothetical protein DL765_005326 [Monosporascus sp. GIB2]|nr:hypothetical protein DL765_005326 [Monosporascus sp. GIB2]
MASSCRGEPIAIVGSGCRFPGSANSPSSLWKLLESPRDLCKEIPPDRFSTKGFYHPDGARHGTTDVRHSYLLDEDVLVFDAAFFNISPNEAEAIDPQQRLLLETVYEALEAGGHTMEAMRGSDTGVYVGTMGVDYHEILLRDINTIPTYLATGTNRAIIANRVSYFFDWHGPSMAIDTACSSSMIAVHQSVKALRSGESRVAVACGTQIILSPEMYVVESKLKMLSPTGRSRMWDAGADGYARGEGVAAIVLKRLSDAIADGDNIECLIRETGANQDGFSNGLTVPNTAAQTALIRQTYARAGLDPENNPYDRPQFFEAHGTGTQAGDPKEAAAIHEAFGRHIQGDEAPLYVGSIKTVVGHLEGAAGLAGLLKASSSIQKGLIPPNLLFNCLNSKIEPYYQGLHVPTSATTWPKLPEGVPKRVSVNSFGFGGTNAHAILEEHVQPLDDTVPRDYAASPVFTPFVFSATSETSLVALLGQYSEFLRTHQDDIGASDLAWTLHARRSQFPVKVAFSASTIEQLVSKIDDKLESAVKGTALGTRSAGKSIPPRILGVFTGQGAQWPAMGAQWVRSSYFVQQRIQHLQESLSTLPPSDHPQWQLKDEMLAGPESSRVATAALSQPLCTAVQIILVDLLHAAGITFSSVVGHSSGEIAAAYAAGFITAHDAIRIAYYRGIYARLAGNHNNDQKGAMLAVGTSLAEAQEMVNLNVFKGRLAIAAHNSSASVTLSGDADAIVQAKKMLEEQSKFVRLLKVDTAYHSHHMLPCGDAYVEALRACEIRVRRDRASSNTCTWFSSVIPSAEGMKTMDELQDVYWRDNMTNTVLFADALSHAVSVDEKIDVALEIGPHPALKGPAMQNIADVRPDGLPYCGVLARGSDDIEAFSGALGFVWAVLGNKGVDLQSYDKLVSGPRRHKLVVSLPSYQWNHERIYWRESRQSRKIRGRQQAPHELLGAPCTESNGHNMRWSNLLRVAEIPWLQGHQLQGQIVFPAAGYVAMALEATRSLAADRPVELFELYNLTIPKAITFEEGDTLGVETLVTLTAIKHGQDQTITADFAVYSCPNVGVGCEEDMDLTASGAVKVSLGTPDMAALSPAIPEDYNMSEVDVEDFYGSLTQLGYGYSGFFRGMSSMKRRLDRSSALVDTYAYTEDETTVYMVHPSMLDVAFQSSMLAYSAPGDGRLWSLHVPTAIGAIRVNPAVCASLPTSGAQVPVWATLDGESKAFSASIDLFSQDGKRSMIQVEDLVIKPFAPGTKGDDRVMFTHTKLDLALPDGATIVDKAVPSASEIELATVCERMAYYYVRKWHSELTDDDWKSGQEHHAHLRDWVNHTISTASCGQHPTFNREWSKDGPEDIRNLARPYAASVDVRLLSAIGENIPAAVRGETTILEHMLPDNMLDDYYTGGVGFARYNEFLGRMAKQITHRYPHARILEIGAGTGGATRAVLQNIGRRYSSYTYTDVTVGFFGRAAEVFAAHADKMVFKVFDMDKAPAAQGFEPHSYDVVIASNVLHATAGLHRSLEHAWQLLRPGGYLMLLEITSQDPARFHAMMGGLAGWWLGADDGRKYSPLLTPARWHSALRMAGFGGVDAIAQDCGSTWPLSVITSQAVDDRVQFLRRPLSSPSQSIFVENLVILGSGTLETAHLGEELVGHLRRFCGKTTVLNSLPTEAEGLGLSPMSTFINLVDVDAPIFQEITAEKVDRLKRMLELARTVVWVTRGAHLDQPYHRASIAFSRAIRHEAAHISLSHLDVAELGSGVSAAIAEHLLQQCALDHWEAPPSALGDSKHRQFGLLWSREPEMLLDGGKMKIPRLMQSEDRNARFNSSRRAITKAVPASMSSIEVVPPSADAPPSLAERAQHRPATPTDQPIVRVESSSLMALRVAPDAFLFLSVGQAKHLPPSSGHIVCLSTTNSSEIRPIASIAAPAGRDASDLLVAITGELLAENVLEPLSPDSCLLVHCSANHRFLAQALSRRAAAKQVGITFTCDQDSTRDEDQNPSWKKLDARVSQYTVRNVVRRAKPTHFLDLTAAASRSQLSLRIERALPLGCVQIYSSVLSQSESLLRISCNPKALCIRLQDVVCRAEQQATPAISQAQIHDLVIPLDQFRTTASTLRHNNHTTSVVHWPVDRLVHVEVHPLDMRGFFRRNKTYLLAGLSGQIGQSLCEWMVANGAGCVCLTSRAPDIDKRWLESFKGSGATVKVYAMDVCDMRSVETVVEDIRATCPPIAGVGNGAMVLQDQLFFNISTDAMRKVLGPKIDGSNNLDRVFFNDDLDFFLLFSSGSCVLGNAGQSSYAAANGFLHGLVRQRRSRGLAASAIDIGRVAGIGYSETVSSATRDQMSKFGFMPISETDFRQTIAETIQAGHVDPAKDEHRDIEDAVVTTGLRPIYDDEDIKGPWFTNAIFSHCVVESTGTAGTGVEAAEKKKILPVGQRLSSAATAGEALGILQESFAHKLHMVLQLAGDEIIDPEAPLVGLGIDSLVAVQVRSWFLKEVKVDIPVLKVVGGSSLHDICEMALKKLPDDFVAQIGTGGATDSAAAFGGSGAASPKHSVTTKDSQPPSKPSISISSGCSSSSTEYEDAAPVLQKKSGVNTPASEPTPLSLGGPHEDKMAAKSFVRRENMSLGQSRFWFLRLLVEDPTTFNVSLKFGLMGHVHVGNFERAVRTVTARHESLRTCFVADEAEPDRASQKILAHSPVRLERKTVSSVEDVASEYAMLRAHEFDLTSGPLLRLVLLTLSPTHHYLLVNYHHIIMDMVSFQIVMAELEKAYMGRYLGLPPQQYPDFSVGQRRALEGGDLRDELEYWRGVFPAGEQPPVLPLLPMARASSRPAVTDYKVHQVGTRLDPAVTARVKSVARDQQCTPFHFYLAAFKSMLFAFTDAGDLAIGIADANRNDSDVMGSVGLFLNLLALRFRRRPGQSFADATVEARNTAYGALEHSRVPFDVLLEDLGVARSSAHSPLFQAFFDYRQEASDRQTWGGCRLELEEMHPGRTAYDISLDVADFGVDVHVTLRVQTGLYDLTAANLLLETYTHLIHTLGQDMSLSHEATPLFSETQLARAVQAGLGPELASNWPATLPHRIDQVAREHADNIALADGLGGRLTYADMMDRIEAVAEALLDAGVGAGSRVLAFQQSSCDWVCSILAIMRIGGVYVPLDLRNPLSRLAVLAKDCRPSAVLADATTLADSPQLNVNLVVDVSTVASMPARRVPNAAQPDAPAAILYTSGSTGTPKGITLQHAGMRNEMEGYTRTYQLGAERVLQQSAFTFDFSMDQIFTGLVNGGMIYVVPYTQRGDPVSLTGIVHEQAITYTKVTPSEYSMWMQYGGDKLAQASSWRFAFAGGEPLTETVLRQFARLGLPQLRVHNSYGPAEISIASHKMEIDYRDKKLHEDTGGPIPCGYSLPNYATYILDDQLRPLPPGMPGEVVIGGPGVSLGYLTNQELSARVFVPNPYASTWHIANGWTRMHRTGDVGHLQADGSLVFRSRMAGDTQVKLRGLRIELRDIETNIVLASGGVLKDAVVTLREGDPELLVAHVVFAHHDFPENEQTFLEKLLGGLQLPQYMIPIVAIPLDKMPLTNHAKVDRKAIKNMALPERAIVAATSEKGDTGMTETMVQLRRLWRDVLGPQAQKLGPAITASTSFFQLGGNSLLIVRLQSRIRQALNVAVRLVDLLNANTLAQMAHQIEQSPSVDCIDWDAETAPPSLPSFLARLPAKNNGPAGATTILLTGATGNLAKHLLPLLSADKRVGRIHCVAVRGDKPHQPPLSDHPKVISHAGDLSLPLLGLEQEGFYALAAEVDVVLHLGAARAFWDNYRVLQPANVHSTRELVKLAARRRVPIHFVSSGGVLPREGAEAASSAAAYEPPANGSDGYVATKWASERLLERSAGSVDLAVQSFIYRLLPAQQKGQQQPEHAKQQVLDEFARCIDLAGSVPDATGWAGRIHLIAAESVARWLCASVLGDATIRHDSNGSAAQTGDGAATARFYHYESPVAVGVDDLMARVELVQSQRGRQGKSQLVSLPLLAWMGRIKAVGFGYVLASQEATVGSENRLGGELTSRR